MWLLHDISSPSERSTFLTNLLKGTEYELKIRPYFDEFQGKDSQPLLVRTQEEGKKYGNNENINLYKLHYPLCHSLL